jgi:twinkle protein
VTGPTGIGKTSLLSQMSLDYAMQGVNTLWGSFEIKNDRLAVMQLKQFSAVNTDDAPRDERRRLAGAFDEQIPIHYLTFHGAQEVRS